MPGLALSINTYARSDGKGLSGPSRLLVDTWSSFASFDIPPYNYQSQQAAEPVPTVTGDLPVTTGQPAPQASLSTFHAGRLRRLFPSFFHRVATLSTDGVLGRCQPLTIRSFGGAGCVIFVSSLSNSPLSAHPLPFLPETAVASSRLWEFLRTLFEHWPPATN